MKALVAARASLALAVILGLGVVPKAAAQYTSAEQKAVSTIIGSLTPDVPKTLDPGDPTEAAYLQAQFQQVSLTRDLKTVMRQIAATPVANVRTLKQALTTARVWDIIDITSIAFDPGTGTVTASGLVSIVGGNALTFAGLTLIDLSTFEPLAPATINSDPNGLNLKVQASARAKPDQKVAAVLTALVAATPCQGNKCVPDPTKASYAQTIFVPVPPASTPKVTVPTHTVTKVGSPIIICLGRYMNPDDPTDINNCDYADKTQTRTAQPYLRFPFEGYVNLRYPAKTITSSSMYLQRLITGGGCPQLPSQPSGPVIGTTPTTVTWTLVGANPTDGVQWAQFGQDLETGDCWVAGPALLFAQISITDSQGSSVTAKFSTDPTQRNAYTGTTPDPTTMAWGCIAAGTKVTMADGSAKPIEQVFVGETVKTDRSRTARVNFTYRGFERKPLVEVTDEFGSMVTLTQDHPVPVGGSFRQAKELRVGDKVGSLSPRAAGGLARITKVAMTQVRPQAVEVYNLEVDVKGPNATFAAGGIVVGDNAVQSREGERRITAALNRQVSAPRGWEQDFETARRIAAQYRQRRAAMTR
jgi:hypothetical protein